MQIFIDGAARGNPGPAGAGVFIKTDTQELVKEGFYLGEKTNNQAEYLALALAAYFLKDIVKDKNQKVLIISDSELLVKQINGQYKISNPILFKLKNFIDNLLKDINYSIKHVLRENNKIADKLANIGVDKKIELPKNFIILLKKEKIL